MSASIIFNVSDQSFDHSIGLCGTFHIPAKPANAPCGILVIQDIGEIQDSGDGKSKVNIIESALVAADIIGRGSDDRRKLGIGMALAHPDVPRSFLDAIKAETDYLGENRPEVRSVRKGNLVVAVNMESTEMRDIKIRLSSNVKSERDKFNAYCLTLISPQEIAEARARMIQYCSSLVGTADRMWARPYERVNITDCHLRAAPTIGHQRPWAYMPEELIPCPGCGGMIKIGIIVCPHCQALLDEPIEDYALMTPKEKATRLYPHLYAAEPEAALTGPGKPSAPRGQRG